MYDLIEIGKQAKAAAKELRLKSVTERNAMLLAAAEGLEKNQEFILSENGKDIEKAAEMGLNAAMIERLTLNGARVRGMADGLRQVASLPDPLGESLQVSVMPNGLRIEQRRAAMGVIGIIYESRPNVTADAFGLCIKAGSAVILRGGKEALYSNSALVKIFQQYAGTTVQLITDTSREIATAFMGMRDYVDVLIPRGGAGLIRSVVENSRIPVIETGTGNCHIFVDESANLQSAADIIVNAKAQRPSVCNACETLLLHQNIYKQILPPLGKALAEKSVELRGDTSVKEILPDVTEASEDDWSTEFNDYILAIKVVCSLDEALSHIAKYSTGHSEAIITENYSNSQRFLNEVDSAAVYVNASTRFTDGEEFGFGAEIGISTQKLHARGPMGLKELTTTKYVIYGSGQVRL